jgi:hypothetical protein
MGFSILSILILIGFFSSYMMGIKYLHSLRNEVEEKSKIKDTTLILVSIFWGSPVTLIQYCMFEEFRIEDRTHKHRMLILELVILVAEIVLVVLLVYFGVIKLDLTTSLSILK